MWSRAGGATCGVVALLAAALVAWAPATTPTAAAQPAAATPRPNVVFVLTDDMRADDMRYMDYTRRLFAREGTTFTRAISPHPLCCPARAELVTGQYAQNNGVHHNTGPWGGYEALTVKDNLIFDWFQDDGYRTAYFGKYLNGYVGQDPVSGLTYNDMSVDRIYSPNGVVTYNNGDPVQRRGHQTLSVTRAVNRTITDYAGKPFFIWAGYVAPHGMYTKGRWIPSTPPKGYDDFRRRGDARPQTVDKPSFNVAQPVQHKRPRPMRKVVADHVGRVKSLYAVDDGVERIVSTLKAHGVWEDTILVFTSDNGYGLGAHRMKGKNDPYQDAVRVPLMMTGPGIPTATNDALVTLPDLPVTLTKMSGVTPGRMLDGADLFDESPDRAVLIQGGAANQEWGWRGVYTERYTYVRWSSGEVELYDRADDPYELVSIPDDPAAAPLQVLLDQLATCRGQECRRTIDDEPAAG